MSARQISLPFRFKSTRAEGTQATNSDLIGRSYEDGDATITVIETCTNESSRVIVRRDTDGHSWSMPAWLMRLVFTEKNHKRAA